MRFSRRGSGASPAAISRASPSTTAVLPTPGSPTKTGLLLVRRHSTCITRLISFSRPITGSSSPSLARCVRSVARWSRVGVFTFALGFCGEEEFCGVPARFGPVPFSRISLICLKTAIGVRPIALNCFAERPPSSARIPSRICSVST